MRKFIFRIHVVRKYLQKVVEMEEIRFESSPFLRSGGTNNIVISRSQDCFEIFISFTVVQPT